MPDTAAVEPGTALLDAEALLGAALPGTASYEGDRTAVRHNAGVQRDMAGEITGHSRLIGIPPADEIKQGPLLPIGPLPLHHGHFLRQP